MRLADCHCRVPKNHLFIGIRIVSDDGSRSTAIQYISSGLYLIIVCLDTGEKGFLGGRHYYARNIYQVYPIVGLAFFFFSRQKVRLLASCLFWGLVCFVIPVLYTPGFEYVISQYIDWFERLKVKNMLNMFADPQNISLLGVVRKISGNAEYSDMWLIIPGLILFCIPYLRISQYKYPAFRFMLLANVLLFVVLFSTGSEASGYIIANDRSRYLVYMQCIAP